MRILARALVVVAALAAIGGAKTFAAEKIQSSPTGDRIVIDGDPSDWEGIPVTYLEDSLRVSATAHDNDNLYLMYRFADEGLARTILMRGVTLWINGNGKSKKKNEQFAVRYPGSVQIAEHFDEQEPREDRYRARSDGTETPDRRGPPPELASMRQEPGKLTVIRMGVKETIAESDPDGPTAASNFNQGLYFYELKIPFASIGDKVSQASPAEKRRVSVGVEIGGMTEAELETMQAAIKGGMGEMGAQGGRGGGIGGRPAGSLGEGGMGTPGGGMGGRGSAPRNRLMPEITWLSITMAASE